MGNLFGIQLYVKPEKDDNQVIQKLSRSISNELILAGLIKDEISIKELSDYIFDVIKDVGFNSFKIIRYIRRDRNFIDLSIEITSLLKIILDSSIEHEWNKIYRKIIQQWEKDNYIK